MLVGQHEDHALFLSMRPHASQRVSSRAPAELLCPRIICWATGGMFCLSTLFSGLRRHSHSVQENSLGAYTLMKPMPDSGCQLIRNLNIWLGVQIFMHEIAKPGAFSLPLLVKVAKANACTGEGDFSSHNLTVWPNSPISSTIFSVLPGGVVFSCSETKQNKQTEE